MAGHINAGNAAPAPIDRPRSYLSRLWNGHGSLPSTYWLWGGVGSFIAGAVVGFFSLISETVAEVTAASAAGVLYSLLITIAIWRSARRYKVKKPNRWMWGTAAQLLSASGLLFNIVVFPMLIPGHETGAVLDYVVDRANFNAPRMIAPNIRFDTLSREGRNFIYHYTVLGPSHALLPDEVLAVQKNAAHGLCSKLSERRLLLSIGKASFTYYNEQGDLLMDYDVSHRDCP